MKTFKLASLGILDNQNSNIVRESFPLLDGLIINREDETNQWIVEAYLQHEYYDFFAKLNNKKEEILIQVKITTESNEPATFITTITGVNKIGAHMNVLFRGTIIDQHKEIIEEKLKKLIDQGYSGDKLLEKFKEET
ncbi:YwpF family protein [Virgibacillus doumboii]|uniref:YwpF family protein n=1 Tax=Virgibacillus doumboii TaxID=2697503 RepID=UPI0013DF99AB|nr:YwpF family protein [Virgibacillus doumboii]